MKNNWRYLTMAMYMEYYRIGDVKLTPGKKVGLIMKGGTLQSALVVSALEYWKDNDKMIDAINNGMIPDVIFKDTTDEEKEIGYYNVKYVFFYPES
jgi:hypothetical protein